nr:MAG TPA: hydrolase [Caudoviricetes sp.]
MVCWAKSLTVSFVLREFSYLLISGAKIRYFYVTTK